MSTLSVELPDDIAARLAAVSEREHVSPAQIVCRALDKELPAVASDRLDEKHSLHDLMEEGFGCVHSNSRDLATNPKHLEGFGEWRR